MAQTLAERRRAAIQSIESRGSGGYSAIGAYNERLGRPLGAYQIMEVNIPQWSQEALGRKVSSMEFLKSPEIQDAIFDYKMDQYAKKYGEKGAAEAWFAGPGGVGQSGRKDAHGTTVAGYGDRYLDALTGGGAALPREMFEPGASEYRSQIPAQIPLVELTPLQKRASALLGGNVSATPTAQLSVADRARALLGEPAQQQPQGYVPGVSGPVVPTIAYGTGAGETPYPVAAPEGAFDITRSMSSEYTPILGDVARSLTGQGPSPGASMLPEETPFRGAVGRVIDVGLGAASGLGAGMSGAAGLVGDVARGLGMETGRAERLATDVMAMPEAFAGSIGSVAAPTRGARISASVPAPTRENAATLAQQAREGLRGAREAAETNVQRAMGQGPTPAQQGLQQAAQEAAQAGPTVEAAADLAKRRSKMGQLISRAAKNDRSAMDELAATAKIDQDAAKVAEDLGIKVPFDVLADDQFVQEVAGILRSARGTDEALAWQDDLTKASERAFEVMRGNSTYGSLSEESDRIRRSLEDSIESLRGTARGIYDETTKQLPPGERVQPGNMVREVNAQLADRTSPERLPAPTKKLYDIVTDPNGLTYTEMKDLKGELLKAQRGQGEYKDASDWIVNSAYNAVSKDMVDFAAAHLGDDAAKRVQEANGLWRNAKELEEKLTTGFGKNLDGSIATLLTNSIRHGAGGNIQSLNTAINVIPKEMRKDAILSAIDDMARSKTGPNAGTGFSFQNFAKTYNGLRSQPTVFAAVAKEIGPEATGQLQSLYEVSRRIARAQDKVTTKTGASLNAYFVDGLMTRVLDSSAGNAVKSGIGAGIGGALGGPLGAAAGAAATSGVKLGGKRANLAHQLFRSEEFNKVMAEAAATGRVSQENAQRLIKTPGYQAWAKSVEIKDPEAWLMEAIAAQQAAQGVQE